MLNGKDAPNWLAEAVNAFVDLILLGKRLSERQAESQPCQWVKSCTAEELQLNIFAPCMCPFMLAKGPCRPLPLPLQSPSQRDSVLQPHVACAA